MYYDCRDGKLYKPFEEQNNISYNLPIYYEEYFYFLKGDFNRNIISIIKCYPKKNMETIFEIPIDKINLYNLRLIGQPIHLIHQLDSLISYYPKKIEVPLEYNEGVVEIKGDRIYCSPWIEKKVENNLRAVSYSEYSKLIIKDLKGNIEHEEIGSLQQFKLIDLYDIIFI